MYLNPCHFYTDPSHRSTSSKLFRDMFALGREASTMESAKEVKMAESFSELMLLLPFAYPLESGIGFVDLDVASLRNLWGTADKLDLRHAANCLALAMFQQCVIF